MKWKTTEEVKEAAKDKMSALKMSLKHHEQGRDCTRGELVDALDKDIFNTSEKECACCVMANERCSRCPLCSNAEDGSLADNCCDGKYLYWMKGKLPDFRDNPTPANFQAFQQAESKICDYIQGVIDAEEKKDAKPELDYDKPIVALSAGSCGPYLLLPSQGDDYEEKGYDWLDLKTLTWNSCKHWDTKANAVGNYNEHTIINIDFFDDIAKRGEELEKFKVVSDRSDRNRSLEARPCCKGIDFWMKSIPSGDCKCFEATVDQAQEICDNLQKVINFAKNKDGKK